MERLRRIAEALKPYSFELAREVAHVSLAIKSAAKQNARINSALRSKVNRELVQAGLDGNGRFEKPGLALAAAASVLTDNGIEFDEVVHASRLMGDDGHTTVDMAFTNREDVFSPISIRNSMLAISWYKHAEYKYEAVAYIS